MTTWKTRTGTFLRGPLVALVLGASIAPAMAQDFSPSVVVNDEIITGYDIDQRLRLLQAASGGEPVTREQATEQLVNDILRMQAAKRAGIAPTPEQIIEGFDDLSRSQGRDPQTMRQYFRSKGVSDQHLNKQIEAEVAWRELIPRTYMPRIRISEAEVEEAMGVSEKGPTEPEFLVSEIRLPIGASGEQAALRNAATIIQRLQGGGITFGDLARQYSKGASAATGGDQGWLGLSTMSPAMQQIVAPMSKDRVSAPFVDGTDIVIVGIRDTRAPGKALTPASYRISQLVIGVAPDAAPSIASLALQQAQAAKARISDCASVEALKGEYLPISGSIGTLTPDQMPAAVRNTVLTLPVGGISDPIRSNDGFHVIVLCDKVETDSGGDALSAEEGRMRRQLTTSKLGRYSASLMRKLRREAVIERR